MIVNRLSSQIPITKKKAIRSNLGVSTDTLELHNKKTQQINSKLSFKGIFDKIITTGKHELNGLSQIRINKQYIDELVSRAHYTNISKLADDFFQPLSESDIRQYLQGRSLNKLPLYHATAKELLPKIKKEGFKAWQADRELSLGTAAYLGLDPSVRTIIGTNALTEFRLKNLKLDQLGYTDHTLQLQSNSPFQTQFIQPIRNLANEIGRENNLSNNQIILLGNEGLKRILNNNYEGIVYNTLQSKHFALYNPNQHLKFVREIK